MSGPVPTAKRHVRLFRTTGERLSSGRFSVAGVAIIAAKPLFRERTTPGNSGHRALVLRLVPESGLWPPSPIEQWWMPLRRQQAGSVDSASEPNTGATSERAVTASSKMARERRKPRC